MFSDTCVRLNTWYNKALGIMQDEVDKKNNMFLQEGKRVKYAQGTEQGRPDKGLSPIRNEEQVIRDRAEAEKTGETTFTTLKDMLSKSDAEAEIVSFQYLQGMATLDLNTVEKLAEPGYVGPKDLTFTMHSYYEQLLGVQEYFETNGIILQPPSMLSRSEATHPGLAQAEKWWLSTWEKVRELPEQQEGGYLVEGRRVDTVFIKTSVQTAHLKELETKKILHEQKQAQGTPLRAKQKREHEGAQYAPIGKVNIFQPLTRNTGENAPTEIALEEPNELDKKYQEAIEREAAKRPKTGTSEAAWDNDRARILVLIAEQLHKLATEGATCPQCGTKGVSDKRDPQQGLNIVCPKCNNMSLIHCDTMESAGIPTELVEQAQKLMEIKKAATTNLEHLLEKNSKEERRTCTARERQLTQTALRRLEVEGLHEQDQDASISLIGTGDREVVLKIIAMGERLFFLMQEDLPEIERIHQAKKEQAQAQTSEEENALELKALQQQLRERQETTQEEAVKIDKLRRKM